MRRFICSAFVALGCLAATPAMGCRIYNRSANQSVIHPELPRPFPPGAFAFDVQFEHPEGSWTALFEGTRAHVRRVVRGDYSGEIVIVRDSLGPDEVRITCYNPIRNEGAGLIVGTPAGYEEGVLVLRPIFLSPPRR